MREHKVVRKSMKTVITVNAKCNKCGISRYADGIGIYDLHSFRVTNGYGDKFDGHNHFFDLCDKCYCKMIKGFKIKVTDS